MAPKALVFAGQGAQRKAMCMDLLQTFPSVAAVWERCKESCYRNYGFPLQEVLQENPSRVSLCNDALDVERAISRSCREMRNLAESTPRDLFVSHEKGVMHLSYLTQPCMVAAQLVSLAFLQAKNSAYLSQFHFIGGHSLGEFTALAALDIFPPEVVMDLTYKRGLLMDTHLGWTRSKTHSSSESSLSHVRKYGLCACNPTRAGLDEDPEKADDLFFCLVELVARSLGYTTSFVEVVNCNILHQQYVVAGDLLGLTILGKALDPQFRKQQEVRMGSASRDALLLVDVVKAAVKSVVQDRKDGIPEDPNKDDTLVDFVSSSARRYGVRHTFRRFIRGPDDGFTPSLDELTHLTLEDGGRSGLKRKTWFLPLNVEVPFHSSRLQRAMDEFLPVVLGALPEEKKLRSLLSVGDSQLSKPLWVTNLTGRTFQPFDREFQEGTKEAMSALHIGEVRHVGRYSSDTVLKAFETAVKEESVRGMCAAVLAAQLAHPVMWIDTMNELVVINGVREVHEISPTRNLSDMFKRNKVDSLSMVAKAAISPFDEVKTKCFPADKMFFEM